LRGAGNALTVAAVQAVPPLRAQLSLVRPEADSAAAPADSAPTALTVLALPLSESAPLPSTPPMTQPATMPELEDDRHMIRNVLASGLLLASLVAGFLVTRPHTTLPANGALTPVPSAVASLGDVTATAALPTPTRPVPTAVPTPGPLVLALGAKVQVTGLNGAALNVRQNPGTKAKIVGKFQNGATGLIKAGPQTADGVQWWQITGWDSGGTLGWVSAKYLKPVR
jgi:hypothetical protein